MGAIRKSAVRVILAFLCTLVIMYLVPLPIYAFMSGIGLAEIPDNANPMQFMMSVLAVKIGVAIGFVQLMRIGSDVFFKRWFLYSAIWWAMFAIVEFGQAIAPNYSIGDAVGGAISEAIYFPLSAWTTLRLLAHKRDAA